MTYDRLLLYFKSIKFGKYLKNDIQYLSKKTCWWYGSQRDIWLNSSENFEVFTKLGYVSKRT